MKFIIINTCPLQNDALENYVRKGFCPSDICTAESLDSAVEMLLEQRFDGLILSTRVLSESISIPTKFRDLYLSHGSKITIVLLDNADDCHVAQLLYVKAALFIDKNDVKQFFDSVSYPHQLSGYYMSPAVESVIGAVPERLHPLWQLNSIQLVILSYILQNHPSKIIACALKKKPATIEDYRKKIKDKILISGGKSILNAHLRKYLYWVVTSAKHNQPQ